MTDQLTQLSQKLENTNLDPNNNNNQQQPENNSQNNNNNNNNNDNNQNTNSQNQNNENSNDNYESKTDENDTQNSNRQGSPSAKHTLLINNKTAPLSQYTSFDDLKLLKPEIIRAVQRKNWERPSIIQAAALPLVLTQDKNSGTFKNLIAQAKNGAGKTGAFCLSLLQRCDENNPNCQALVLCHTRELAIQTQQVCDDLAKFTRIKTFLAVPGKQYPKNQWNYQIVIGTPGWTLGNILNSQKEQFTNLFKGLPDFLKNFKMLVVDEADELMRHPEEIQRGRNTLRGRGGRTGRGGKIRNTFGNLTDQLVKIVGVLNQNCKTMNFQPQILFFSATFPKLTKKLALKLCTNPNLIQLATKNLKLTNVQLYEISDVSNPEDKFKFLVSVMSRTKNVGQCIIFVNTIELAKKLVDRLQNENIPCSALYGRNMKPEFRDKTVSAFVKQQTQCLVASNVIARGLDVPAVNLVINYEIPLNMKKQTNNDKVAITVDGETFIHRVGRTGRFGRRGNCINIISDKEQSLLFDGIKNQFAYTTVQWSSKDPKGLAKEIHKWLDEEEDEVDNNNNRN